MRVLLGGGLETAKVQRRRKAKSKPRDVFSKSSQPQRKQPPKSPVSAPVEPTKPGPKLPPSKPEPKPEPVEKAVRGSQEPITEEVKVIDQTKDIVESQILGEARKSIGLREKGASSEPEVKESSTSKRAQDIIDKSRARAMESLMKKTPDDVEIATNTAVAPKKKSRKAKPSFQPAERKKRLDRSRHMEYKYEVRKLLIDLDIDEEHRSSILGTVWAKGERQTVSDAKEYLSSKLSDGVLDDSQIEELFKVVDNYTIRR